MAARKKKPAPRTKHVARKRAPRPVKADVTKGLWLDKVVRSTFELENECATLCVRFSDAAVTGALLDAWNTDVKPKLHGAKSFSVVLTRFNDADPVLYCEIGWSKKKLKTPAALHVLATVLFFVYASASDKAKRKAAKRKTS